LPETVPAEPTKAEETVPTESSITTEEQPTEKNPNASNLTTVAIQIDGSAVPYYAPLYIAQEKGFFAENGLNVEFYYASAADIVKMSLPEM
jgi:ABC-type nitrate/sulfonate/bicarbonate transport system substrate-binding protein